jgi:hypothetical protein
MSETITLHEDPHGSKLGLKTDVHKEGYFGIFASDEAGYTGVLVNELDWEMIRARVDEFLAKRLEPKK